ncbi:hypothetical protein Bbelb_240970 [Branchiostoma belcheri]|nr:hypothetical protein Bbelb_240970 [Branchiostoma belcheri]
MTFTNACAPGRKKSVILLDPDEPMDENEAAGWRAIHDTLLATGAELSAPTSFRCTICKEEQPTTIYRCQDCGPTATFCKECLYQHHNNSLHLPEIWKNSCFQPVLDKVCLGRRDAHTCTTGSSPRTVKVFDESGRPRVIDVDFCPCEPEPCTLLRLGLWAASTEAPATAFSVSLLEWLVVLSLECHISVEGFCNAVRWKNNLSLEESSDSTSTSKEHCNTSVHSWMKEHAVQYALSYAEPHHGTRMFADDDTVQDFMSTYSDATKPSEDCSNFQAGSRLRSKNKQTKLDVSGVFGAACRHEVPLLFVNMTHGERLGYPVFVLQRLVQQAQGNNLQLQIIYDIACVLKAHLSDPILYSPRRMEGFGLTDGEGMERLWSYLRPFFRVTKEMTPSHRLDLLTDATLHYARRKSTDIESSICSRWDKAEKAFTQAQEELSQIISQAPVDVSEDDIKMWCAEEKTFYQQKHAPTSTAGFPKWKKEYVTELTEYYTLREELGNEDQEEDLATSRLLLRGMKEKLVAIEKKHNIGQRWKPSTGEYKRVLKELDEEQRTLLLNKARTAAGEMCFLLTLKGKYPDGQAIAVRLSRQLKTISGKLDKTCEQYNSIPWAPQHSKFPPSLNPTEARRPDWEGREGIPGSLQRSAIDALNQRQRAEEEKGMLKEEMTELMRHLLQEHAKAKQALWGINSMGQQSLLITHLVSLEKRLQILVILFRNHLPEVPELPLEYSSHVSMPVDYWHEELDPALEHTEDLHGEHDENS